MQRPALSVLITSLALASVVPARAAESVPPGASAAVEPALRTLTLAQALELVDRQNPDLAQQRARTAQAEAAARQALSALLPMVTAKGNYTRNSDEARLSTRAGNFVLQARDAFTATGRVQLPLFAQNAYWDVARARELDNAERAGFEAGRQRLRGAVVRACWLVESARGILRVAERAVASASEHYDSTRRAAAAGTATRLAVLQAQSDLARRRGQLSEARAGVERAQLALGALLGRAEPVRIELPAFREDVENPARAPLLAESLGARQEVVQRAAELRASEHAVTSSALRYLPALSGAFDVFASDQPYLTGDKQGWRAGLDLTWTLYDGGDREGQRSAALAEQARAQAAAQSARLAIELQVQDALLDVQVARDRLVASSEESQAADETSSAAQRSFAAGQASSLDVIDALDRRIQAAVGLETARAELGLAQAALRTARGIAW